MITDLKNRIFCADAFTFLKTVHSNTIDLILTDPPYDLTIDQQLELHEHFKRICKGAIIVFCPPENQWIYRADQYLFWIKSISTKNTSKSYSRFVEMICVYQRGAWNSHRHWSQYTNVFTDLVDDSKIHPFRKPPSLIKRLLLNHSNEGDLVLDPFMGSGVTILSCMDNKRNFLGVEKSVEYWTIVEKELQKNNEVLLF